MTQPTNINDQWTQRVNTAADLAKTRHDDNKKIEYIVPLTKIIDISKKSLPGAFGEQVILGRCINTLIDYKIESYNNKLQAREEDSKKSNIFKRIWNSWKCYRLNNKIERLNSEKTFFTHVVEEAAKQVDGLNYGAFSEAKKALETAEGAFAIAQSAYDYTVAKKPNTQTVTKNALEKGAEAVEKAKKSSARADKAQDRAAKASPEAKKASTFASDAKNWSTQAVAKASQAVNLATVAVATVVYRELDEDMIIQALENLEPLLEKEGRLKSENQILTTLTRDFTQSPGPQVMLSYDDHEPFIAHEEPKKDDDAIKMKKALEGMVNKMKEAVQTVPNAERKIAWLETLQILTAQTFSSPVFGLLKSALININLEKQVFDLDAFSRQIELQIHKVDGEIIEITFKGTGIYPIINGDLSNQTEFHAEFIVDVQLDKNNQIKISRLDKKSEFIVKPKQA